MTIRSQAESISDEDTVKEKRRRKRICRFLDLERKGLWGDKNNNSNLQLSVSFGNDVGIRVYAVGLGDNPSVSSGVPICLKGEYIREYSYPRLDYEGEHNLGVQRVRSFVIPPKEREMMLHAQGYAWRDIHKASQTVNHIKASRGRNVDRYESFTRGRGVLMLLMDLVQRRLVLKSDKEFIKECIEFSRRIKIQYDLQEEAILSGTIDVESLSIGLRSLCLSA
jgi:hypothetical protein